MNITELYYKLYSPTSDKGTLHSYIEVYEQLFAPYRDKKLTMVEVGVYKGGSIYMWQNYFTNGTIIGIDIDPSCKVYDNPKGPTVILDDATKKEVFDKIGPIDIIIDDGSHKLEDAINTFNVAFPKLNSGGLYIIEDVQDLATWSTEFNKLNIPYHILDIRHVKNRYDDLMFIFFK